MKTTTLIILIILIGLCIGGFFVWKNIFVSEEETEVEIYKGIWLPALIVFESDYLASNMQKLKDIGINAVFLQGLPALPESYFEKLPVPPETLEKIKELLPIEKELMIADIQTAHRNGLKVVLTTSIDPKPEREEMDLEALNSKIIEYAKLAKEYNVSHEAIRRTLAAESSKN